MSEIPPYPPIEPANYDLIVVGTGLPESLIAAASSTAGKSVLHLDPNPFYGSHFSSLSLPDLSAFLNSHSTSAPLLPPPSSDQDFTTVDLGTCPLYSSVEISNFAPDILEEHSRKFSIDVAGPRVLFCADKSIELMIRSGAHQYVEFKSIDASFMGGGDEGKLWSVPDSRAAIFKDKNMTLSEKNLLMRFFKLVQEHLAASSDGSGNEESKKISEEDLDSSFIDFLSKMRLPPKIKSIILYAIAMADYDQETAADVHVLKTKDGIDRLTLYSSSVGRFPNAPGALLYPIYGQGELSQAFCRRAAVKGCLYVLRMTVSRLLMDKETGHYKGVRLNTGQDIFSHKLILDPSISVSAPLAESTQDQIQETLEVFSLRNDRRKVARGICITRSSVKPDMSNGLVVYPPKSLFPEQVTTIRALQIGSSLAVCPSGMFVLYLSAYCEDDDHGKRLLRSAMDALLTLIVPGNRESSSGAPSDGAEEDKPILLWSALYIQELTSSKFGIISSPPMPDGNLDYSDMLEATSKLYQQMFPDDEFFRETLPDNSEEEDGGLSQET